ncbi:MAG: tRNA (guanine37-N1)-methyltransferase [Patescibacteria group bacterium]|nr:tRNA (guanine37-N1)-methyltransferase [Patescibacteria group bacterium]
MTYHIISLFPQSLDSYLNESILKRAQEKGLIKFKFYNPRDFSVGTSYADRRVDDKPYGGGPGMVIEALPVIKAIAKAVGKKSAKKKVKIIWFVPSGKQFDTEYAKATATKYTDIIMICGRYEGIDSRVKKAFKVEEISVGPFVLTGGELPAMILVDTISRQIKGVLGDHASLEESRIASPDVYTRPEVVEYKGKKYRVPKVLLSGNHKLIDEWRNEQKGK